MKITDKQFDRLLTKLKVIINDNGHNAFINFDNDYFMIDGTYDFLGDKLELEFYIEDSESELTGSQTEAIYQKAWNKIQEYKRERER